MRILIAGAGDLGARIATRLRAEGAQVEAIARRPRPDDRSIHAVDLGRPFVPTWSGDFDLLLHCLTPASRDEAGYRVAYIDALRRLLDVLPEVPRVVFVSSTAVYGDHGGAWVDEDTVCRPQGFNGRVLLEAEALLRDSGRDVLLTRPGGLYGPGRESLLRRVLAGEPLPEAEAAVHTHRIHIDDAATVIARLARGSDTGTVNLVDDVPAPLGEVLDWLADRMARPRLPRCPGGSPRADRRIRNARLQATGLRLVHPDYRSGYAALLQRGEGGAGAG